jgi:hypothetical protein
MRLLQRQYLGPGATPVPCHYRSKRFLSPLADDVVHYRRVC